MVSVIAAAGTYGAYLLAKNRCFQFIGEVTCRVATTERAVALSFDDGPTPDGVASILPVLASRHVQATFFLIGNEVKRRPDLTRWIVAAGHDVENHSYSHTRMIGGSMASYRQEIASTDKLLRAAGARPMLFRPPGGARLFGLPLAVDQSGYRMVTWSVEDDRSAVDARAYADHVLSKVEPGSIILIHAMRPEQKVARTALPLILDGLHRRGYRIMSVRSLIDQRQAS